MKTEIEKEIKRFYKNFQIELDYFARNDPQKTLKLLGLLKDGIENSIIATQMYLFEKGY